VIDEWGANIDLFIEKSNELNVRMILVGGGAVNFHGYQRHSADVDFWIETTEQNLNKYDDLIDSKLKAQRPKDLLDIQQLEKLRSSQK